MRTLDFIFLLLMLIVAMLLLLAFFNNIFYSNEFLKGNVLLLKTKTEFLSRIRELVINCFEKYRYMKEQKKCYEITYLGREEIYKGEIISKISSDIRIDILFERILKDDRIIILYSIDKIQLKK